MGKASCLGKVSFTGQQRAHCIRIGRQRCCHLGGIELQGAVFVKFHADLRQRGVTRRRTLDCLVNHAAEIHLNRPHGWITTQYPAPYWCLSPAW